MKLSKFHKILLFFLFFFGEASIEKGFQFRTFGLWFVIQNLFLYQMAQSAPKEIARLGIRPLWDKLTLDCLLRCCVFLKLAIFLKVRNSIEILEEAPPLEVVLPPGPVYEENVENSRAQNQNNCRIRRLTQKTLNQQMPENILRRKFVWQFSMQNLRY